MISDDDEFVHVPENCNACICMTHIHAYVGALMHAAVTYIIPPQLWPAARDVTRRRMHALMPRIGSYIGFYIGSVTYLHSIETTPLHYLIAWLICMYASADTSSSGTGFQHTSNKEAIASRS